MENGSYLQWLVNATATTWWNDSAEPREIREGLQDGMTGVTTNPVLAQRTLQDREQWEPLGGLLGEDLTSEQHAEALTGRVVRSACEQLLPVYERTDRRLGYVCAQVNPARAAEAEEMLAMARRFAGWAPNVAVKLPVTAAGLDTLEECTAGGITVTATVSFTVPQVLAVAERYQRGLARARAAGVRPGRCFAVIMAGRLDDYVRDVARDRGAKVTDSDLRQAGLAVTKRAYALYNERDYEAILLIAAMRGNYHVTEVAGGELVLSVPPRIQASLNASRPTREARIDHPVPAEVIDRLQTVSEFRRAYEPDGMAPEEFITYGVVQRTLTQFSVVGWDMLEKLGA